METDYVTEEKLYKAIMRGRDALKEVAGAPLLVGLKYDIQTEAGLFFITDRFRGGDMDSFVTERNTLPDNDAKLI